MPQKFNSREIVFSDPKKSSLDKTYSHKGSGKVGRIIPVMTEELIPNTTHSFTPNSLVRFVPLAAPLMERMTLRHHVIATPYRQLFDNWQDFITGGENNTDDSILPGFTMYRLMSKIHLEFFADSHDRNSPSDWLKSVMENFRKFFADNGYYSIYVQQYEPRFLAWVKVLEDQTLPTDNLREITGSVICTVLNCLVGKGSLFNYLGYPSRDYDDFFRFNTGAKNGQFYDVFFTKRFNGDRSWFTGLELSDDDQPLYDDSIRYNEAYIRKYYRDWYYYFRDQNLDFVPMSPESASFKTSTRSLLLDDSALWLLILRPACWAKDLYNTCTLQAYENNGVVPVSTFSDHDTYEFSEVPVWDQVNNVWTKHRVPATWLSFMSPVGPTPVDSLGQDMNDFTFPSASDAYSALSLKNLQKIEALSKFLDKNLYVGWTYADQLSSHFGVRYSDARMQIPEYVGGTKSFIDAQTLTNGTSTSEQVAGSQTAYAQGITANDRVSYFAEEHCIISDYMSVIPSLSYENTVPRSLLRQYKFDFAFPEFAQLGSDAVSVNEVHSNIINGYQDSTFGGTMFGYADRYFDYKANVNRVSGELLSTLRLYTFTHIHNNVRDLNSRLYVWDSFARLNADFVHCVPSLDVFVSDTLDYEFVFDCMNEIQVTLPLPVTMYV